MIRELNKLHLKYKRETGRDLCGTEIEVYRSKGRWILEACDDTILDTFGRTGILSIPDTEYVQWLEEQLPGYILSA
ncbi:hypothetical protein ES708_26894 [subsurface metagenome]